MEAMVQVVVARDLTEAEEIQTILQSAGIPSELEVAVEQCRGLILVTRRRRSP